MPHGSSTPLDTRGLYTSNDPQRRCTRQTHPPGECRVWSDARNRKPTSSGSRRPTARRGHPCPGAPGCRRSSDWESPCTSSGRCSPSIRTRRMFQRSQVPTCYSSTSSSTRTRFHPAFEAVRALRELPWFAVHLPVKSRSTRPRPRCDCPVRTAVRGPAWLSRMPHPVRICRTSALSSPFVAFKNRKCGAPATMTPPFANARLVGMLRCSAKTVNLSARPSPLVSSRILMRSSARISVEDFVAGNPWPRRPESARARRRER